MFNNLIPFLLLLFSFTLVSCTTSEQTQPEDPLLPLPKGYMAVIEEPGEEVLRVAIEQYLKASKAPAYTRYEFSRIDLDDDMRRDAIVLMKTPHRYWCTFNGCRMAVFKAYNNEFRLVSEIEPVRGPLLVTDETTNGWRDLVIRVSGRTHWEAKDVALKFNGTAYPANPELEPPLKVACNEDAAVKLFP